MQSRTDAAVVGSSSRQKFPRQVMQSLAELNLLPIRLPCAVGCGDCNQIIVGIFIYLKRRFGFKSPTELEISAKFCDLCRLILLCILKKSIQNGSGFCKDLREVRDHRPGFQGYLSSISLWKRISTDSLRIEVNSSSWEKNRLFGSLKLHSDFGLLTRLEALDMVFLILGNSRVL
jgi:hypothetical protein